MYFSFILCNTQNKFYMFPAFRKVNYLKKKIGHNPLNITIILTSILHFIINVWNKINEKISKRFLYPYSI